LKNSCVIEIIGDKDKVFDLLQGQVTSDIKLLEDGQSQLSCICNHKGMIMADFIIIFDDECYKLVIKENVKLFSSVSPIKSPIRMVCVPSS